MSKIRVRFAPSPTGLLHIGSLRTALYNFLFAKHHLGDFLLRIEDTDRARFVEGGVKNILESLNWGKTVPDEGPYLNGDEILEKGDKGPYVQSARLDLYHKYADELLASGKAYHCFCTAERLEEMRAAQVASKLPPMYDGLCRTLSREDVQAKLALNIPYVVRFAIPKDRAISFEDLVRGQVSFESNTVDDQVLVKSDGFPTYHLASIVDDHLMEITHVLRSEEWLTSTPKHILLYEAFGWKAPEFAHLPQLLNPDRTKLSKRQGDVAALDYRDAGYLPEAVINFIALLGWTPEEGREIYSLEELVKLFDICKIAKAGAVFNREKLDWFNGQYLRALDSAELKRRLQDFAALSKIELIDLDKSFANPELALKAASERAVTLKDVIASLDLLALKLDYQAVSLVWAKSDEVTAKRALSEIATWLLEKDENGWVEAALEIDIKEWIKAQGFENGAVLWPLRVALSGQEKSAPPFTLLEILGKAESLGRIQAALKFLG
ncbi:MAG: glutamate--tRNA ligase [bacterium]